MPIKNNFILKEVGKDYMIIPVSSGNMEVTKVFNINETGAFIYKMLKDNKDVNEIAISLTKEYEGLDLNEALSDIDEFVLKLKEKGIYYD